MYAVVTFTTNSGQGSREQEVLLSTAVQLAVTQQRVLSPAGFWFTKHAQTVLSYSSAWVCTIVHALLNTHDRRVRLQERDYHTAHEMSRVQPGPVATSV